MSALQSRRRLESGFVLVAVLWILAALATLASIYSAYTVNTACRVARFRRPLASGGLHSRGVEMAAFQQLAVPEQVRPSQGGFTLRVGRTSVAVRFRSEGARVDLNAAPADLLAGLFAAVGVDSAHAKTFADRVIGWRTKPKHAAANAETPKRRSSMPNERVPYPPRQGPFEDTLELSLLPGLPVPVVERVLPFVTVFSGRPELTSPVRIRWSFPPCRA